MLNIESDKDDVFQLGERRLAISINNIRIETPASAVTNSDFNRATKVTTRLEKDIYYPNAIFENQDLLYRAYVDKRILDDNGRGKHSDTLDLNISTAKTYSNVVASYYVPIIDGGIEITRSLIAGFVKMQLDTELDFVTIIDSIWIPPKEMNELISVHVKDIQNNGKKALYALSLHMDVNQFSERITNARNKVSGIVAFFDDYEHSYDNYDALAELRSDDGTLRIISGINKKYPGDGFGGFYPLGFLASDIFSPAFRRPPMGKKDQKKRNNTSIDRKKRVENERRNARRFDSRTGGHLPASLHKELHGKSLACDCPICRDFDLDDLLGEFEGNLNDIFGVHDVYSTHAFVKRSSGLFHNGELFGDLKSRKYSNLTLENTYLSKGFRNQQKL